MKKNFINFHFQNQVKADEQKFQKGKKYVVFFLIFARQEIKKFQFFVKKNAIFSHFQNQVKADEQQFQNLKKYLIFFQIFTRQGIENLIIFVKKSQICQTFSSTTFYEKRDVLVFVSRSKTSLRIVFVLYNALETSQRLLNAIFRVFVSA